MKLDIKYLFLTFYFFFLFLIIIFSTDNAKKSSSQSDNVTEIVIEVIDKISRDDTSVTEKYSIEKIKIFVRKFIGHFGLFACLGLFAFATYISFILNRKIAIGIILSSGLLIAFISETIQIFSDGRVPSFIDVGIDYSGYLLTSGVCILIYLLIKKHSEKKIAQVG